MWSNMWSKAILDQSRGEVKKKKCQCRNGFSGLGDSAADLVFQLPKQARYQLRYTRIREILYRISREKAIEISSGFAFWDGGWYNRRKRRDDAWKRGVSFARRS